MEDGPKVVSFQAEDGMTIYGTLHLPKASNSPVAGVIFFAEPGTNPRCIFDQNEARDLTKTHGMASLTIDFRGNGKSNGKRFRTFSRRDLDKLQLDVRGAIKFLSSQDMVDSHRIGIVAVGKGTNYALLEAAEDPAVQALVLISGSLSDQARDYIRSRSDIPILCLAGRDDKEGFREMAEAFYLSKNKNSDILLSSGHGSNIFTHTKGLSEQVAQWLADNVKALGVGRSVFFDTEDGWNLHGRLSIPDGIIENTKVPGVLLVHGAQHDQDTYCDLAKALVKSGIATLTYDWRGKNRDITETRGHYGFNLRLEEDRDKAYLDVRAAINFLAMQESVDANRIGIVAATRGTLYTYQGVSGDTRVKTLVMLTLYCRDSDYDVAKQYFQSADIPIFFIASADDLNYRVGNLADATKAIYELSKNKYNQFLLYDDTGRGSEMLKTREELQPMIVRWFVEKLARL